MIGGPSSEAALYEHRIPVRSAVIDRRYNKFKYARSVRSLPATDDRGSKIYRNPSTRKSSRGSSKLQLPNDVTNCRRYCSRAVSIFQSLHAKNSSVKEHEPAFSSSSMSTVCFASHLCSAARTAAPSTLRKPCIFVCTSSRCCRSG